MLKMNETCKNSNLNRKARQLFAIQFLSQPKYERTNERQREKTREGKKKKIYTQRIFDSCASPTHIHIYTRTP